MRSMFDVSHRQCGGLINFLCPVVLLFIDLCDICHIDVHNCLWDSVLLEPFGAILEGLEPSGPAPGRSWAPLGASWGALGGLLEPLEALLGGSWGLLGASCGDLWES